MALGNRGIAGPVTLTNVSRATGALLPKNGWQIPVAMSNDNDFTARHPHITKALAPLPNKP